MEERRESTPDLEYRAVASLSHDKVNVTLDDVLRVEKIINCWRDAGKLIATMPKSDQPSSIVEESSVLETPITGKKREPKKS